LPYKDDDPASLVVVIYEWLRDVGPNGIVSSQPTKDVVEAFVEFACRRDEIDGVGPNGLPSNAEVREVMYRVCTEHDWWDLRGTKMGKARFPEVPLRFRNKP
jgi:hypothetical protein